MRMRQAARSLPHHRLCRQEIDLERLAIRASTDWGVSKSVMSLLRNDPELFARLDLARHQRPFSSKYRPTTIEIFYDEICLIRAIDDRIIYNQLMPELSIPTLVEVKFDGEMAMFLVNCEPVIDRTTSTLPLANLLRVNPSNPTSTWNTVTPL
jgi:hypothetical protein